MKSLGTVIDQQWQPQQPFFPLRTQPSQKSEFPLHQQQYSKTQSMAIVLEQTLTTQDRPLLKQLLQESNQKMIVNSVAEISSGKVNSLMGFIEEFLYSDSDYTEKYTFWLQEIVCRHTGIILTNPQNQAIISRIRKFIEKKNQNWQKLSQIKPKIHVRQNQSKIKKYKAQFKYIQEQDKVDNDLDKVDMKQFEDGMEDEGSQYDYDDGDF